VARKSRIDVSTNLQDRLATELAAAHERVRRAISNLTEEQAMAVGPDGWSIKDHLAHLTLWHEMRFFEISRIGRGGSPSFPHASEEQATPLNETAAANRRGLTLRQVIADLEFAWSMVEQAVSVCPEDCLELGFSGEIGPIGSGHDIAHAQMIKALRQG
jgi:hypothetical protein